MADAHKADKGKPKEKKSGGGGLEGIIGDILPFIAVIIVVYILYTLFQKGGASLGDGGSAQAVFGSIHRVWSTISTVLSMVFIGIGVYSWVKHTEHGNHEAHEIKHRFEHAKKTVEHRASTGGGGVGEAWKRIDGYVRSENPSDWKIAILEADSLLEDVITNLGYHGENFGEKLKSISPSQFPYLDHAWEAHKFRNDIAHSTERPLAHAEATRILGLYERVFRELKVL